jgi:ferrous iron transport protein A
MCFSKTSTQDLKLAKNDIVMPSKPAASLVLHSSVNHMLARSSATVLGLIEPEGSKDELGITRRLAELGFLPGEKVTVLRRGPGGREPLAVQIGDTVFALRSIEAQCIKVDSRAMAEAA